MMLSQVILLFASVLGFWYEIHKVLQAAVVLHLDKRLRIQKDLVGNFIVITVFQVGFVLTCTGVYV